MAKPEVPGKGMKELTHTEQGQTELQVLHFVQVGRIAESRKNRRRVTAGTHHICYDFKN